MLETTPDNRYQKCAREEHKELYKENEREYKENVRDDRVNDEQLLSVI